MYRYLKYEGHWEEGVKEGHGVLYFVNEDSITGTFEHGQPHGIIKVIFNKKKKLAIKYCGLDITVTTV